MKTLAGPYSDDVRMAAARTLGQYRASESVSLLVANLELERHVASAGPTGMSELYAGEQEMSSRVFPLTVALEKIGEPAVPAVIGRIKVTDDVPTVLKLVSLGCEIEGQEVTQFRMQGELEKEHETKTRGRILLALQMLDDIGAKRSLEKYRVPPAAGITNLNSSIESKFEILTNNLSAEKAKMDDATAEASVSLSQLANLAATATNAITVSNIVEILVSNIRIVGYNGNPEPAVTALARVGDPAVPRLLKIFEESRDADTVRRAAQALAFMKGPGFEPFVKAEKDKMSPGAWEILSNAQVLIP